MSCLNCGAETPESASLCSRACVYAHKILTPSTLFDCPGCGRIVMVPAKNFARRKYCSLSCATATYNREHRKGNGNGRWRGGRALSYGPGWKQIKAEVRARDRVCRVCDKAPERNGRALDVHHLDPFRFSGNNDHDNLVALCRSCHGRIDDHGRRGAATFLRQAGQPKRPTKREIRRLKASLREAERAARRTINQREAERLAAEGASLRQIAKTLGVSHQTVANWLAGRYSGNVGEPAVAYLAA